jgi:RNA polymerase sigma-70 factor, ECF subfamily
MDESSLSPMMTTPLTPSQVLLQEFRGGDNRAGDVLIRRYQPWLTFLASREIDTRYRGKFDASDIVQQALLEAVRDMPQFHGQSEGEFRAWLRTILAHVLAHQFRRYRGTQKRDVNQEVSLNHSLQHSSTWLSEALAGSVTSPSLQAARSEQELLLADVLTRLPDDYREVIVLRNLEGLSHEEVARRMGRGVGAVRMLWVRALARLRQEVGDSSKSR